MKAILKKYNNEQLVEVEHIDLPEDYDGDPYGDSVPFTMASNWTLETEE